MLAANALQCAVCANAILPGAHACASCGTPLESSNPSDSNNSFAPDRALEFRSLNASSTPDSFSDALPPQSRLQNGAFVIESVLGQGGFGITYRGRDGKLNRDVAIKEFFPTGCRRTTTTVSLAATLAPEDFAEARARFGDEARLLARFRHRGIVHVYSVFEENNTAYMVMELLHGQTLSKVLSSRGGRLEEAEARHILNELADALETVHAEGLLHRDIKPENVIVTDDNRVVLIDFGSAKEVAVGARTQVHSIVVTPGYAPLEQYARRARRGPYTDVYALAATFYYLLTGEAPPAASDRAVGVELTPLQSINPKISRSLAQAIERGLEIEISKRPQSIAEFMELVRRPPKTSEPIGKFTVEYADPMNPRKSYPTVTYEAPEPQSPKGIVGDAWHIPLRNFPVDEVATKAAQQTSVSKQLLIQERMLSPNDAKQSGVNYKDANAWPYFFIGILVLMGFVVLSTIASHNPIHRPPPHRQFPIERPMPPFRRTSSIPSPNSLGLRYFGVGEHLTMDSEPFSEDQTLALLPRSDQFVRVRNMRDGRSYRLLRPNIAGRTPLRENHIQFSPDNRHLLVVEPAVDSRRSKLPSQLSSTAAMQPGVLELFDIAAQKRLWRVQASAPQGWAIDATEGWVWVVHRDGKLQKIALASGKTLEERLLLHPSDPYPMLTSFRFSPDGLHLATVLSQGIGNDVSNRSQLRLWDLRNGTYVHVVWNPASLGTVRFSPDGRRLMMGNLFRRTGALHRVLLFDTQMRTSIGSWQGIEQRDEGALFSPKFSHDGTLIAHMRSPDTLHWWDTRTNEDRLVKIPSILEAETVTFLKISRDGRHALITRPGKTPYLWDFKKLQMWQNSTREINNYKSFWLANDGDELICYTQKNTLERWPFSEFDTPVAVNLLR